MNDVNNLAPHREALTKLVNRSATDAALRERLLNNPHATIEEEIGVEPDQSVRFVEPTHTAEAEGPDGETPRTIVLPDVESRALSEDELEAVSGGTAGNLFENLFADSE